MTTSTSFGAGSDAVATFSKRTPEVRARGAPGTAPAASSQHDDARSPLQPHARDHISGRPRTAACTGPPSTKLSGRARVQPHAPGPSAGAVGRRVPPPAASRPSAHDDRPAGLSAGRAADAREVRANSATRPRRRRPRRAAARRSTSCGAASRRSSTSTGRYGLDPGARRTRTRVDHRLRAPDLPALDRARAHRPAGASPRATSRS